MPESRRKRGKVATTWDFEAYSDMTFPADGYALPRRLHAHATEQPELPGVEVALEVEIVQGRARATSVTVSTADGVGWTALSKIPVRDIVGTAVLTGLHQVNPAPEGRFAFGPLEPRKGRKVSEEVRGIVQDLVSYRPDLDRLEGVAG